MSRRSAGQSVQRAVGCLAFLLGIPLLYYGLQAAMRTRPQAALQVIAHRGGMKVAPENTLAAFKNAIAQGVDALEFDVQMTQDGELVVIHDETVDRTTDGKGAVRDLTLAQIRTLDAGNGEKVPTLKEVVDLAKASQMPILAEAKSPHLYPGIEQKMWQVLKDAHYLDRTIIQSFEANSLERFHQLDPSVRLCALYGLWQLNVSGSAGGAQIVCPMAEMVLLNPFMVRQAHAEGRRIIVWVGALENPFVYRFMRFFGADGLITSDPAAARTALAPN